MQKVDLAIAIVGAFALIATGLGVAFYDDINGHSDYTVSEATMAFTAGGAVPGAGASFDVDVPDNMYHAMMEVTISFASPNPAASCTINALVTVTAPDGQTSEGSGSFQFSSGSGVIEVASAKFGMAPENFSGDEEDREAKTLAWDEPLTIDVNVQGAGCGAPVLGVGGATFSAAIAGDFHGYAITGDTPEPEAA